jgi:hypothetical protein
MNSQRGQKRDDCRWIAIDPFTSMSDASMQIVVFDLEFNPTPMNQATLGHEMAVFKNPSR